MIPKFYPNDHLYNFIQTTANTLSVRYIVGEVELTIIPMHAIISHGVRSLQPL